ncbi:MAG: DUF547 domain-containing protein [Bacteroidetes bacterium]|nr:DUF547 domain-containing protein [Bacteroidota bacterium]
MKHLFLTLSLLFMSASSFSQTSGIDLSISFFEAVKKNSPETESFNTKLAELDRDQLEEELNTDLKTLAFWINIYNANIQYQLKKDPKQYKDRGAFFKNQQITVAGELLSFDKIEHGILRRSKTKWSLGYFGKIFVPKFERQFRIKRVDARIHYALNCGANSCPPIYPYTFDNVNEELDKSCENYLEQNVQVKDGYLYVPVLFSWFRADFGGKRGVRKFLLKYKVVSEEDSKLPLVFKGYDWSIDEDPYRN